MQHRWTLMLRTLILALPHMAKNYVESHTTFSDALNCCITAGLSPYCAKNLCQPTTDEGRFFAEVAYELPERCRGWEFDRAAECLADGRNHSACCGRKAARTEAGADVCLHVCVGAPLLANISDKLSEACKDYTSCLSLNYQQVLPCFARGYESIPGPPVQIRVTKVSQTGADLGWSAPEKLPQKVASYLVHYATDSWAAVTSSTTQTHLHVDNLHPNQNYTYYVVSVSDDGSRSLRSKIGHFVTGSVAPTVEPYQRRVTVPVGGQATLICQIRTKGSARKAVESSWSRAVATLQGAANFRPLPTEPRFSSNFYATDDSPSGRKKKKSGEQQTGYLSTLHVKPVTMADYGTYKCRVISDAGLVEQLVTLEAPLNASGPPDVPPDLTQCCKNEGVSYPCSVLCNNDPNDVGVVSDLKGRVCTDQMVKISRCLTGLVNVATGACCLRRRVPSQCLDFCTSGLSAVFSDPLKLSKFGICTRYNTEMFDCMIEGQTGAPHPPTSLRFSQSSDGQSRNNENVLTWEKSNGADSYFVYLKSKLAKNWTRFRTTTNKLMLPNLRPTTFYTVAVLAQNSFGFSDSSRFLEISV